MIRATFQSQEYEKPSAENITVYYNNDKTVKPIDLGTYQVYIDIEETDTYAAVTGITSDAWKFTIIDTLSTIKEAAKEEIDTAVEGVTDEDILAIANTAKTNVDNAATVEEVDSIKTQALADLSLAVKFYNRGYAAGYARGQAEGLGEMGTPCEDCPAVEVTKGTTTIRLYNPDKVEFKR